MRRKRVREMHWRRRLAPRTASSAARAATAQRHCIAKEYAIPGDWGVFDLVRGAWPALVPGYGVVSQHVTQGEAETQAARLNRFFLEDSVSTLN